MRVLPIRPDKCYRCANQHKPTSGRARATRLRRLRHEAHSSQRHAASQPTGLRETANAWRAPVSRADRYGWRGEGVVG